MDIRSFFSPKAGVKPKVSSSDDKKKTPAKEKKEEKPVKSKQKSKKRSPDDDEEEVLPKKRRAQKKKQIDSDSDEEPLPPKIRKSKSSTYTSTERTIIPESDDEEVIEIPKSKTVEKPKQVKKDDTKTKHKEEKKKVSPPKINLKPTTADSFFGTAKIQRVERSSHTKRKKADESDDDAPKRKTEKKDVIDILDDDDELEKCIQNMEQVIPKNTKKEVSSKDVKQRTPEKKEVSSKDVKQRTPEKKEVPSKDAKQRTPEKKTNGHAISVNKDANHVSSDKRKISSPVRTEKTPVKPSSSLLSSSTKEKDNKIASPKKEIKTSATKQQKPISPEKQTISSSIQATKSPVKPCTPMPSPSSKVKESEIASQKKEIKKEEGTPPLEKKKSGYMAFKTREGPRALGSKEIPEGAENCMEGLTFVITGILDAIDRDEAVSSVQRYGGKVTTAVSGKTSYLITGRDPGESKLEKAKKHRTKQIDEDGFLDLIRTLPGKKSKYEEEQVQTSKMQVTALKPTPKSPSSTMETESHYFKKDSTSSKTSELSQGSQSTQPSQTLSQPCSQPTETDSSSLLWVDKYSPMRMKDIIGQHGDKSNANKLIKWLVNWHDNHGDGKSKKTKGSFFAAKEDGSLFKAALLSGPPGIGKTTTATITCKTAEFSFVEMNASDARSKKTLEQVVAELLTNSTMDGLLNVGGKVNTKSHAIVMDEVDGMAGNEDRGGVQELIALIKKSKIPIICMCNDRNHPKIRSLANHCFDLRFYKPRVEQIKGFAMKVAFKEGLKIPPPAMEQIIIGANQDIRQVLHNLQMWTSNDKSMTFDQAKSEAKSAGKNIKIGPFEVIKKLFTGSSEADKMTIQDKTELFFNDYSFVPLFVQENYLSSQPWKARGNIRKTLELTSQAADALADSNLVETHIRGSQSWNLLPLQGFFSCVVAPDMMRGGLGHMIQFPQWLGKNSSRGKHDRILQELKTHMKLSTLANKSDLNMEYLPFMRKALVSPLANAEDDINEPIRQIIDLMDSYDLTKEDYDSIMEISKWEGMPDETSSIPSKVKAAFTRTYNKESHLVPYAAHGATKKARGARGAASSESQLEEEESIMEEEEEESDNDVQNDTMIKSKKKKTAVKGGDGNSGKGRGKGTSSVGGNSGKGKGQSGKGRGKNNRS